MIFKSYFDRKISLRMLFVRKSNCPIYKKIIREPTQWMIPFQEKYIYNLFMGSLKVIPVWVNVLECTTKTMLLKYNCHILGPF